MAATLLHRLWAREFLSLPKASAITNGLSIFISLRRALVWIFDASKTCYSVLGRALDFSGLFCKRLYVATLVSILYLFFKLGIKYTCSLKHFLVNEIGHWVGLFLVSFYLHPCEKSVLQSILGPVKAKSFQNWPQILKNHWLFSYFIYLVKVQRK